MKRLAVMAVVGALALALSAGAAMAANFVGTDGDDRIVGTDRAYDIAALDGRDSVSGRGGDDDNLRRGRRGRPGGGLGAHS